ncbi:type III polyketide synthase [Rubripirellula amarantea]|nr:type III polyketide synthase [Rubripirellula amarantea]
MPAHRPDPIQKPRPAEEHSGRTGVAANHPSQGASASQDASSGRTANGRTAKAEQASSTSAAGATATMLGIGTAVPVHRVASNVSAKLAKELSCSTVIQSRKVAALYRRTGIEHRGSVLLDCNPAEEIINDFYPPATSPEDRGPGTKQRSDRYADEAPRLAIESSKKALADAKMDASEITHLVTISCTGFSAPGIDIALIDDLGLPATTQRVQVGFMGCHAAINGLRVAQGLVAANPEAKVLMCSVELCTLHYQYGYDPDRIVSGALFADGSAAVVLQASTPDASTLLGDVAASGSYLVPDSRDAMTWRIGDSGFEMTLSARVPGLIESDLKAFLVDWLAKHGETIDSIQGWAVHPGGSRILTAVEKAIDLPKEALAVSRSVLSDHGNMSSATMLFILQRFAKAGKPKPWLMLGFGPGLEIEVTLIR